MSAITSAREISAQGRGERHKRGCLFYLKRGIAGLLVLVIAAIAIAVIAWSRGLVHFPPLTGQYPVGKVDYYLLDESRPEIFSEAPDDLRELMVTIYYPADIPEDASPAPFTEGALKTAFADVTRLPGFVLDTIRSRSFTNVAIASSTAQFPVLIFSPGMGFMPLLYTPTLEEVASQGYIVVALSHPYSTGATVFPDGRVIRSTAEFGSRALSQISATATTEDEFAAVVNQIGDVWTGDIRFTLDQLERMNAEDPFLTGRLDLSRVGVFGHSMGGGAAVEALHDDPRFLAAINMDGSLVGDSAWEGINRPVMLMLSDEQASVTTDILIQAGAAAENAEFIVARGEMTVQTVFENGAPGYLFVLDGSKHVTYTTGSALSAALAFGAPADAFGTIPAERADHIINAYIVSFFDQYLKGEPSRLLEGAESAYPEVTLNVHVN
ncbi:MAG: hypothetical protein KJ065_07640 [Anaerolineae bacterium]|nr:hypothetical protein [Anaerolineae bacterium]